MISGKAGDQATMLMQTKMIRSCVCRFPALFTMAAFILLSPFSMAYAGRNLIINSDMQFNFAEECFSRQDYSGAISEYNRFIHFFPEDNRVEPALFRTGMSYFKSGNFKKALVPFTAVIDRYTNDLSVKAYFMISKCHVMLREPGQAVINLRNLIHITDNMDTRDEAYYRTGWIHIRTASWEKAKTAFRKMGSANHEKYRLKELISKMEESEISGRKNPSTAGLLSVVPGMGFLYCERYRDAATAFLLNAGLILAASESFDRDLDVLGGLITLVELSFYSGNIYGSINSAHKYNRRKNSRLIEKLKNNSKINLSAVKNDGLMLSFRYDF